jgi:hypothetical protein
MHIRAALTVFRTACLHTRSHAPLSLAAPRTALRPPLHNTPHAHTPLSPHVLRFRQRHQQLQLRLGEHRLGIPRRRRGQRATSDLARPRLCE